MKSLPTSDINATFGVIDRVLDKFARQVVLRVEHSLNDHLRFVDGDSQTAWMKPDAAEANGFDGTPRPVAPEHIRREFGYDVYSPHGGENLYYEYTKINEDLSAESDAIFERFKKLYQAELQSSPQQQGPVPQQEWMMLPPTSRYYQEDGEDAEDAYLIGNRPDESYTRTIEFITTLRT